MAHLKDIWLYVILQWTLTWLMSGFQHSLLSIIIPRSDTLSISISFIHLSTCKPWEMVRLLPTRWGLDIGCLMQPHQPAVSHTSPDTWCQEPLDQNSYYHWVTNSHILLMLWGITLQGGACRNHISNDRATVHPLSPPGSLDCAHAAGTTQRSYCYMTHSWSTSPAWIGPKVSYLYHQCKTLTITLGSLIHFPGIFSSDRAFSFQCSHNDYRHVTLTSFHFMATAAEADGYCYTPRQPYRNDRKRYKLFCLDSLCSKPDAVCSGGSMQDTL